MARKRIQNDDAIGTPRGIAGDLAAELSVLLAPKFEGLTVAIGPADRWDRDCATFRWSGFDSLLVEERFHRLVQAIPESFRAERMAGLIWLELAPYESVDDFLALPRSEDVSDREGDIYAALTQLSFFTLLGEALGSAPEKSCTGDFTASQAILTRKRATDGAITDAKLAFIRHGVYCDCQVLHSAQPAMAKLYAGAA